MATDNERAFVARLAAGDEAAIDEFVARYRPRIEAIARKRGVPEADCPDVAQEALADALRQLQAGMFREDAALHTWLYRIAHGHVSNYRRRRDRTLQGESLEDVPQSAIPSAAERPEEVFAVQRAIEHLTAEEQFVLLLHEQLGYTLKEIGQMLGLGKSVIGERLQRARQHFCDVFGRPGTTGHHRRLKE